jgi:uncharacterized protein (DUF305 family)
MSRFALAGILVAASFAASAMGETESRQSMPPAGHEAKHAGSTFEQAMTNAMHLMDRAMAAAPHTGDPDRDFLAMMIPHHEGAVEMARLVLIHGRDPLVRQLAEEIIAGQQAEVSAMRARLQVLQKGPDPRPGGFPAVGGTRGE